MDALRRLTQKKHYHRAYALYRKRIRDTGGYERGICEEIDRRFGVHGLGNLVAEHQTDYLANPTGSPRTFYPAMVAIYESEGIDPRNIDTSDAGMFKSGLVQTYSSDSTP